MSCFPHKSLFFGAPKVLKLRFTKYKPFCAYILYHLSLNIFIIWFFINLYKNRFWHDITFGVLNKTLNKGAMNKLLKFHTNVHNTLFGLRKAIKQQILMKNLLAEFVGQYTYKHNV